MTDTEADRPSSEAARPWRRRTFRVLAHVAHLALLLGIGWMLVFLASNHGPRIDLTTDGLYSLTDATELVLEDLDERLRIEVYLSADDELPARVLPSRRALRDVLSEFEAAGRGRVVLRYLDPQQEDGIREQATRLGIKPRQVSDMQGTTLSQKEIWQGLRLLYGGERQKVIPYIGFDERTAAYEEVLARHVQAVQITDRPRIGVQIWPGPTASRLDPRRSGERPPGYLRVLSTPDIADRYELVAIDLEGGELLPEDLQTVVLIRPRALTDRQKFVLDQFVMRGGQLAIFADTADVTLGPQRNCRVSVGPFDAEGSKLRFVDMLAGYGLQITDEVVLDFISDGVPFTVQTPAPPGSRVQQVPLNLPYPYWFRPSPFDWADRARALATLPGGKVDEQLADSLSRVLKPGVSESIRTVLAAPVLLWPCVVELTDELPAGVAGEVLLRTSPRAAMHDLSRTADLRPVPIGPFSEAHYRVFEQGVLAYLKGERESTRQFGLMAEVHGELASYFTSREVPLRPGEAADAGGDAAEQGGDPLDEPAGGGDPLAGPTVGEGVGEAAPRAAEPVLAAAADGARVVVIGDADFLRDDIVGGDYAGAGGPNLPYGRLFFLQLLDWLAGNDQLLALRSREFADRTQRYVDEASIAGLPPREQEARRRSAIVAARRLNMLLPPLLLLGLGTVWALRRRRAKAEFVRSVGGR